jgi:GR25 family glycosyltransferase involved in LPS biosynthesis
MKLPFDTILVINLQRRPDKYERIMSRIKELGLDKHAKVIRVDAIDGTVIDYDWLKENGIQPLHDYYDSYRGRGITMGEIGCALSHRECWRMIADTESQIGSALILEDDAQFTIDFLDRIPVITEQIETYPWDLFYLGRKKINMVDEEEVFPGVTLAEFSYWCLSYILTKTGAQKLYESKFHENIIPADEFVPVMIGRPSFITEKYLNYYDNIGTLTALGLKENIIVPETSAFVSSETEKTDVYFNNNFYQDEFDKFILITVATEENDQLDRFKKSCEYFGVPYKILGLGQQWNGGEAKNGVLQGFGGGQKVNLLKEELKTWETLENHIVMFTDSYDVILLQNPAEILNKFRAFTRPVVFSAEKTCWPNPMLEESYPEAMTEYRFLNSGGFIGYADHIFNLIQDEIDNKDDDQLYYTEKYLNSLGQVENIEKLKRIDPIPKNDYPVGKTGSQIGWMSEPVFDVEIKEYLRQNFQSDCKILDIGAGDGKWGYVLGDYFNNIDGIEIFESYKERYDLTEKYKNVFIGDFLEFDFEYYDVIILGDVFEHVTHDQAKEWLKKIKKKCKEIIVVVPFEYEQDWDGEYENEWGHHHQPDLNVNNMINRFPELTLKMWTDHSDSVGKGKGFGWFIKTYNFLVQKDIFLDTYQFIFQTLNQAIDDVEIDLIGKVFNTVTKNYPSILHANGPKEVKDFLNNKSDYMFGNYDFVYGNKTTVLVKEKSNIKLDIGVFFHQPIEDINLPIDQLIILSYPKNLINVKLYYNDKENLYKLEKFKDKWSEEYNSIEIHYNENITGSKLDFLQSSKEDYALIMDSNHIFRNTKSLNYLIDYGKKIIAPMIVSETNSFVNFHTNDLTNKTRYVSFEDKGTWSVEIISGIILIEKGFIPNVIKAIDSVGEYSDGDWDVKMSNNLRKSGNFLYICNNHYFGSII